MQTFLKEAKRKQKWMTFARIHRLACQRNNLPCAPSIIMFRQKCAYWDPSGFQEVLPWFGTLAKVQYHQYTRSQKIHWTLITQEMREDLQIDFSQETFFGCFFGTLPWNVSIQNPLPPPKKNRFLFGLGRPIRHMLSIFQDNRTRTLSNRMGLF